MPLLQIDAGSDDFALHGGGDATAALGSALAGLAPGAPVVVLIHGYKYAPGVAGACPHDGILSLTPRRRGARTVSWPRHLGFGRGDAAEGLCVAFGWPARGTIWRAWSGAGQAGAALARMIALIATLRPGQVDILAHSLGARVALAALAALPAGSVGRAVLMAAAEYQSQAAAALAAPAGRRAEIFNITTRENDLFDALVEWTVPAPRAGDRALGAGLAARNWLDIRIDCADTRAALARLGHRVPPPVRRICHWSAYLRPGLLAFYRDLIRHRAALPMTGLRHALPGHTAPVRTAQDLGNSAKPPRPGRRIAL